MAIIAPTITAENAHQYREQIERVQPFAKLIHVDIMDGIFTPNKSVDVGQLWIPDDITCDIHVMFQDPTMVLDQLISLKPRTIIVPVEASVDFENVAKEVRGAGIAFGVALLADTAVETCVDAVKLADHVLIFSGNLGHQGGSHADLSLLKKVDVLKAINSDIEIGWDGGVNDENVQQIAGAVDVINVGGFIHHYPDPQAKYNELLEKIQ